MSWVQRDLSSRFTGVCSLQFAVCSLQFAVYRLQVVAMVVGCKNGLAGFFADEDSLKADKSLLERETGSDT